MTGQAPDKDQMMALIYAAIETVNQFLAPTEQLTSTPNTSLDLAQGAISSMGLIHLVVSLENKYAAQFGQSINLSDTALLRLPTNPFATVSTLADYLLKQLA